MYGYLRLHVTTFALFITQGEDMNEDVSDDALDEMMARDEDGDGVPDWCNPVTEMGAWLNFRKVNLCVIDSRKC